MAVSADIYLLPCAEFDSLKEACEWEECSIKEMRRKIKEHIKSKNNNCYFIWVKTEF